MSEQSNTLKAKAASLSIRQVIGFETPEGTDWALVHGQQYAVLRDRILARAVLHLVGFVMVAVMAYQVIPTVALALWGVTLIAAVADRKSVV